MDETPRQAVQLAFRRAEKISAIARLSVAQSNERIAATLRRLARSKVRFEQAHSDRPDDVLASVIEEVEAAVEQRDIEREIRQTLTDGMMRARLALATG